MAIAFVNSTAKIITAAASTWSMAYHSSRTGGAAYFLGVGLATGAISVSSAGDNLGAQFTLAKRQTGTSTSAAELWYATNQSSASTRVFVGLSGASSGGLAIGQFTGISTANALGPTGSSAIGANSTSHGASQITSSGIAISFSRLTASTIGTVTVLGGMSQWVTTAALLRTVGLYLNNANESTVTGSYTTSSRAMHASVIAAFFDTAVAAAAGFRIRRRRLLGIGA